MLQRAYSVLNVKTVDAERRVFTGLATTPEPDRDGDVIEPLGVTFTNPLPLLMHHDRKMPVGSVAFGTPTRHGVPFTASIPDITEPGTLKDRADEAWHSVKYGVIKAVSIGYRGFRDSIEQLKSGGLRYLKSEVLELSLVVIPSNAAATIQSFKSFDVGLAAPGSASDLDPMAAGVPAPVVHIARKGARAMQTITEQISAFEATRAAKAAAMSDIMTKAADSGVTLDDEQSTAYDDLKAEVKRVDEHLARLYEHDKINITKAVPVTVDMGKPQPLATAARVIQVKANLPKGTAFTRYAMALARAKGDKMYALEISKQWRDSTPEVELVMKAAIAAGTTSDATWASPLAVMQPIANEFLGLLRPATLIGRIPNLRKVPFNVSVPSQTGGGTYGWVGENAPKPVSKLAFATVTLTFHKCAGIIVLTEELVKISSPSAEEAVRNDMIAGIAQYLDSWFVDPAQAGSAGVSPASITNGTTAITSAGTSPDNARTDMKALIASFVAANLSTSNAVLLMSEANAFALGSALNALGQELNPGLGAKGGAFLGIPVITSQALGNNVVLVDAQGILFADDGGVSLDVSREASVQMDSAPDNPATATTVMVSLWQQNLVGLRAERFITWKRARLASVKYVVQAYV